MTIDPTKIAIGDRVTLHEGEIIDTHLDSTCQLRIQFPSGTERWVGFADIDTHTPVPKPIEVGDWVKIPYQDSPYQILAIDEDVAWVKNRHRSMGVHFLERLTPCEAPHD